MIRVSGASVIVVLAARLLMAAQQGVTIPEEVRAEPNPGKRSEIALDLADKCVDEAREFYRAGDYSRAEAQLDLLVSLADESFTAAQHAHKSKYWKKAELKIAALSRRLRSLAEDVGYEQRDKVRQGAEHLDAIHDKLLAGVMAK